MADSIREALTKAVAEAETPVDTVVPTGTSDTVEAAPPVTDSSSDVSKETADETPKGGSEGKPSPSSADSSPSGAPAVPAAPAQPPPNPSAPADGAPASWNAAERSHWDKLPAEAKAAVKRRETEMRRAISQAQGATTFKRDFDTALTKFEPLLKERGVTDVVGQVVAPLMQIRAGLEIGNPQQKAMLVSTIVRDFGIDIAILDQCLTQLAQSGSLGRAPAPPPPAFNAKAVPELAPLFQIAERFQQASQEKARKAVETVQSLPHYEELREDMADIYEKALGKGREMTLEQCYDVAAQLAGFEPRVKPTVSTSDAAAILARSRRAASSVSGAPQTAPGKKPTSLREQIAAAMSTANS